MPEFFAGHPGRLYVVATLLPLVPAMLILLIGTLRNILRPFANDGGMAAWVYTRLNLPRVELAQAWLSIAVMAVIATLSTYSLCTHFAAGHASPTDVQAEQVDWIHIGAELESDVPNHPHPDALHIGYRADLTTSLLYSMVAIVSTMIFIFSLGYMRNELDPQTQDHALHISRRGRFGRFYLFLCLFVAAMFNLLIADNLLQVFISWELVGVCSFFLISYYYERPTASTAANKAFIVNRVGDVGFLIAIAVAWSVAGTLDIAELVSTVPWMNPTEAVWSPGMLTLFGLGLFLGCVGKSAQFPLQVWLPDAMAGPTPVSALIHAATMVAAGVYMVARCYPLFTPDVLLVIAYSGGITLLIGGTVACVQTDIKKVLAYSTVSQLGYMMLALGVGGWAAGVFHLLTHAFFKALLFLCAGSVIHGLHHEQDLRKMGGLRRKMPVTAITMLIGVLAISGVPLFSGWYSKEAILTSAAVFGQAFPQHTILTIVPFGVAGLTAFYMFRLWFLAFAGEPRHPHTHEHAHESPLVMTVPLIVLAVFSITIGWGWRIWDSHGSIVHHLLENTRRTGTLDTVLEPAVAAVHEQHLLLELAAGAIGLLGFVVAYWRYCLRTPSFTTAPEPTGFLGRAWYFDSLYDALIRRPTQNLARSAARFDKQPTDTGSPRSLDGLLNGIGRLANASGRGLRSLQTGQVQGYVTILGLTIVGLLGMLAALTR